MKAKITAKMLSDAISNVRGAVMICYPMGLPDYDIVRQILEEREVGDLYDRMAADAGWAGCRRTQLPQLTRPIFDEFWAAKKQVRRQLPSARSFCSR